MTWEPYDTQLERNFDLLAAFRERDGHCDVHSRHREAGVRLGLWLHWQLSKYRNGELDVGRQRRLESKGAMWECTKGPAANRGVKPPWKA